MTTSKINSMERQAAYKMAFKAAYALEPLPNTKIDGDKLRIWRFLAHGWYTMARSFLTTHRLGWVKPHTYHLRRSICDKCSHRYQDKGAQQSFCGFKGGCGCGHRRGASLSNKLTLTGWSCPAGKFGKGDNDEKLAQVDIDRRE